MSYTSNVINYRTLKMIIPIIIINLILFVNFNHSLTSNDLPLSQSWRIEFERRTFVTPLEATRIIDIGGDINDHINTYSKDLSKPLTIADISLRDPIVPIFTDNYLDSSPHIFKLNKAFAFLCFVPSSKTLPQISVPQSTEVPSLETIEKLLKPLRTECLFYQPGGWWTYKVCFGKGIKQFHALKIPYVVEKDDDSSSNNNNDNNKNRNNVIVKMRMELDENQPYYYLGKYFNQNFSTPHHDHRGLIDGYKLENYGNLPSLQNLIVKNQGYKYYVSEFWRDGTICDRTGQYRQTEVQYHCQPNSETNIVSIRETSTCNYVLIVQSPHLCEYGAFRDNDQNLDLRIIQCLPILEQGTQWPELLLEEYDDFTSYFEFNQPTSPQFEQQQQSQKSLDELSKEELLAIIERMSDGN